MDIFPTILHLIGSEGYYWKGFGIDLLDSVACTSRTTNEIKAYDLSEKLIRCNFFESFKKDKAINNESTDY